MSNEELIIEKLFTMNNKMSKSITRIFNLLRNPTPENIEKVKKICLRYKDLGR